MTTREPYTVRASSWASVFDCAFKWEGEHLLGIKKPAGLRAHLGTSIHASTAAYDLAKLEGSALTVDDAAGVFVDSLHKPDREVDYDQDNLDLRTAERIGLTLHTTYCMDIAPQFNYVAVEAKLQPMEIDCGGGTVIRLTGSMDRARVTESFSGQHLISDLKTGSRVISDGVVSIKGRSPQLGTYQLMYEQSEGISTEGAQIIALQTSKTTASGVSKVFDAKRVMVGDENAPGLIEIAAQMFRSGLFPPNPSSHLCSEKYCARWSTCPYHE